MTVEDPGVVDFVAFDKNGSDVVLAIADHLPWDDEEYHLACLRAKVESYRDFVLTGQLQVEFPEASGRSVRVEIYTPDPFPEQCRSWLPELQAIMKSSGARVTARVKSPPWAEVG